ncbi:UDP-glycosyltransferase, partial [Ladona fulva]
DLAEFLDGSEQGAIFFSLGSNIKSELLAKERLDMLISSFAALGPKIRVLWKFNPKTPIDNLPSNLLIRKWLPQEDILGHPKLLLFITHGGALSTQEAIHHGIPMVGMPFFADQHTNVRRMVELKVSREVSILTATKESFMKTILSVINDPSYRQNMQRLSKLFRDQPQTPRERAVFWTEFLLRHGEGRIESLRSPGLDLTWYQYFLLDVLAVLLSCILMIIIIIIVIICSMYKIFKRMLNPSKSSKESKKRR